jgi:hypothetical protein
MKGFGVYWDRRSNLHTRTRLTSCLLLCLFLCLCLRCGCCCGFCCCCLQLRLLELFVVILVVDVPATLGFGDPAGASLELTLDIHKMYHLLGFRPPTTLKLQLISQFFYRVIVGFRRIVLCGNLIIPCGGCTFGQSLSLWRCGFDIEGFEFWSWRFHGTSGGAFRPTRGCQEREVALCE